MRSKTRTSPISRSPLKIQPADPRYQLAGSQPGQASRATRTALHSTSFHRFQEAAIFYPVFYPKRRRGGAGRLAAVPFGNTKRGRARASTATDVDRHQYEAITSAGWIVTGYWTLTLLFVWWVPWVLIPWFLTGLVGSIADQIMKRRVAADRSDE